MADVISVTHKGVAITYCEEKDRWEFTLLGRDRYASSLAKAREAVDAKPKDARPFEKFEAWLGNGFGHDRYEKVTVTGVADEKGKYSGQVEVWVKVDGRRQKVEAGRLYLDDGLNRAAIKEMVELDRQKRELSKRQQALAEKLTKVRVEASP
jgi:hypothetical protein